MAIQIRHAMCWSKIQQRRVTFGCVTIEAGKGLTTRECHPAQYSDTDWWKVVISYFYAAKDRPGF